MAVRQQKKIKRAIPGSIIFPRPLAHPWFFHSEIRMSEDTVDAKVQLRRCLKLEEFAEFGAELLKWGGHGWEC